MRHSGFSTLLEVFSYYWSSFSFKDYIIIVFRYFLWHKFGNTTVEIFVTIVWIIIIIARYQLHDITKKQSTSWNYALKHASSTTKKVWQFHFILGLLLVAFWCTVCFRTQFIQTESSQYQQQPNYCPGEYIFYNFFYV